MQYGMPTLIEYKSLKENVELCRAIGLDFIELNMNLPQYQPESLKNTQYFQELAEQYGIYYTIHLDENLNICDFNPFVSKAYMDTVISTINSAKLLNIPLLNMHLHYGVYFTLPGEKIYLFDLYKDVYLRSIMDFAKICEAEIGHSNIVISIENTDGYAAYQKEAIDYLLSSKIFTITWDIGHSNTAKEVDKEFIMKRQDKLRHFHIHDANGKSNHLTLGTGELNIKEKLSLAREMHCRCVLETKTADALKQSVQWLKDEKLF